jgi:hypothetical protein
MKPMLPERVLLSLAVLISKICPQRPFRPFPDNFASGLARAQQSLAQLHGMFFPGLRLLFPVDML